jgi:hypothetical protein
MIVMAASAVDMVVVGMTSRAVASDIVRDVLFACHGMLEMDAEQWHDTRKLSYQERPESPPAK